MLVLILKVALLLLAGLIGVVVSVVLLILAWKVLQTILQGADALIRGTGLALSWLLRTLFWLLTAPIALIVGARTTWLRMGSELKVEGLTHVQWRHWRQL